MIKFDYNNVRQEIIGNEHGIDLDFEFSNYSKKINDTITELYQYEEISNWLKGNYQNEIIEDIIKYAEIAREKFESVLVIGLGSPVIGMKAMTETALNPFWNSMSPEQRNNLPTIHFICNIDSEKFNNLLNLVNLRKSLVIFVSKDGIESETMSMFMVVKKMLEDEIGENYRMHIVACTKEDSLLHRIAEQEGYKCFLIPYKSVGTFAIMSTCGLLPLALGGVNIQEMLQGAGDIVKYAQNKDIHSNRLAQMSLIKYLMCTQKHKNVSVLMSYSSRFKEIPVWCVQYTAEMLSKDYDKYGNLINAGKIPLSAQGCNDQHALLQMLIEGDNHKVVNIIQIEKFEQDCLIPNSFDYTPIGYLGGKSLNYLLNAEINAMKMVLTDYNRPNITITIPKINPYYIGQFMAMFMLDMVIQAYLYNINPFDRAGAENLENYVCAQMGRYGYEETLREMNEKLQRFKPEPVLPE